ncbi:MAG: HAMP domain-containing sensor histidine kinase [Pseudomonadota bacterium]
MKLIIPSNSFQFSLRKQLFLVVSLMIIILALISKPLIKKIESPYLIDLMEIEGEKTTELVAQTSLDALISEDIPYLQSIVDQVGEKNHHIVSIKMHSADNKNLVLWENKNISKEVDYMVFKKKVYLEDEFFGQITIHWRMDLVEQHIEERISFLNYLFISLVMIVGLINILLTHKFVIKPIQIIDKNLYRLNDYSLAEHAEIVIDNIQSISKYSATELVNLSESVKTLEQLWKENIQREKNLTEEVILRKLAELNLQQHRDTLQQQVDKKTKDLLAAVKMANIANQSKSDFLANMSHELRTPMHGILSFAKLGMQRVETSTIETNRKYFSNIEKSGNRLLLLVNDLLDLSKLEAGKMDLYFSKNSLFDIVEACIAEQQARLNELDIKVEYAIENINGEGNFDKVQIATVITNFLSNAIKFTPPGEKIEIIIKYSELPRQKTIKQGLEIEYKDITIPALLFSVGDKGKGILTSELVLIFDKFQQGSDFQVGTSKGTGLGLPICREIIVLHHGKIWAENKPEGGAIFSFIIPVEQIGQK